MQKETNIKISKGLKKYHKKKRITKKKFALLGIISFLIAVGLIWVINIIILAGFKTVAFINNPIGLEVAHAEVHVPSKITEPTMKEWIKNEIESAGMNWDEASKVMDCESKGDPDAHYVN